MKFEYSFRLYFMCDEDVRLTDVNATLCVYWGAIWLLKGAYIVKGDFTVK